MSKIIAAILGQSEHEVNKTLKRLEDKNGNPSHDVRYLADNIQKTRLKIADLNLDPDDTTSEELYHALQIKFQQDSQQFDQQQQLGNSDFASKATRVIQIIKQKFDLPEHWVLKNSVAKEILHSHPPKRLMKQLNFRSVDSLLKREDVAQTYLAAGLLECSTWQKEQAKLASKQDSAHFIPRGLNLIYLSAEKYGHMKTKPVVINDDVGQIALVETANAPPTPLLSMAVLLADSLTGFIQSNRSNKLASLSPALAWWSDMDSLVANLNSEQVSLSITDVCINQIKAHDYAERVLDNSRQSFWQGLVGKYDNQLAIEEDVLSGLKDNVMSLRTPISQPAFEYVEDY